MSMLRGSIYVGARNLAAAVAWYKEKFGLREAKAPGDEEIGDIVLVSRKNEVMVAMGAPNDANRDTPMFNAGNVEKAREWLVSRGVNAAPIQTDRQGTRFFEIHDLENNMIEICEEP